MKSFIRAVAFTVVLTLIPAGSTGTQTPPSDVGQQLTQVAGEVDKTLPLLKDLNVEKISPLLKDLEDLNKAYVELNIARTGQFDSGGILVIPTAEIKPQDVVTLIEDMNVMCRIFDKKLADSQLIPGQFLSSSMRLSMALSQGGRSIEAMYIQGYGALFFTKIDFPLSPPPRAQEEKQTKEEVVDPVWEQMKREMYTPRDAAGRSTDDRPEEKYDPEKVKELKETLIKTLKHATNIRGLKPDESVILSVTGSAVSTNVVIQAISGTNNFIVFDKDENITRVYKDGLPDELAYSSPTVLVIRAKKSDIDAFANGTLSFDQFSQKTQLISYPYLGGGLTREPSRISWPDISSSDRRAIR